MSVYSIEGKVDKRILVLPLIRACAIDGPTVVISDDGNLKNLYFKPGNDGTISGVDIFVTNELSDTTLIEKINDYKHTVYVSSDTIDINNKIDITISCSCIDRSFIDRTIEEEDEDQDKISVIFSTVPMKKMNNVLVLKPEYYKYIVETEEKKELIIIKDKQICKLLSLIVRDKFNMSKIQFNRLLTRKKYELSMK